MKRDQMLAQVSSTQNWDFLIIGGGASGLGTAVDAISRGFRTILLEKADFAQETSSKSTKLIHGGIRYLRTGDFALVREALQERTYLMQNAPHLVKPLSFFLPVSNIFKRLYYALGLKLYDFLAGHSSKMWKCRHVTQKETRLRMSALKEISNQGGLEYVDGQFDDSRLAINLAQTFVELGGTILNYMPVEKLIKENGKVIGVEARDLETNQKYQIRAKKVINATGAFITDILSMDEPLSTPLVVPSQGAHIVLQRSFFPGDMALIVPETQDGRVLFIIPWKNHVLVGTTDTLLEKVVVNPKPLKTEIEYLLKYAGEYLIKAPRKSDILSAFAGIRPLVNPQNRWTKWMTPSALSREHRVVISDSDLITVIGGKWTTYRKIGEDTIDQAVLLAKLPPTKSQTKDLAIHGAGSTSSNTEWSYYGTDEPSVQQIAGTQKPMLEKIHSELPCRPVDVLWAVRNEMARTVEDILARRTRCLLLGAKASMEIAPMIASIMAQEMGYNKEWERSQMDAYRKVASQYI